MSSIIVVGAGREGKGNFGEIFSAAGWELTFLDKDAELVATLNERGSYVVKRSTTEGMVTREVTGFRAYSCDDRHSCGEAITDTDLIALCVYPEDIDDVAYYLAPCLRERARTQPDEPVAIISCTNKNHIINDVLNSFRTHFAEVGGDLIWFDSRVEIRDVIVRRSVGAESNRSLELEAQVAMSQLIQSPVSVDLSDVEWIELRDNIEQLKEVKLYTYNGPHATAAYAGHRAGHRTIGDAMADPVVATRTAAVLEEAIQGVSREFGIDEEEVRRFSTIPALPDDIVDYIDRVAYDPIRKLGGNDRLVGVARFCLAHDIYPSAAIATIVDALHYDEPTDPNAVRLQEVVAREGIAATLSEVSGLPIDHQVIQEVVRADA